MEKPSVLILGADPDDEPRLIETMRDVARIVAFESGTSPAAATTAYRQHNPALTLVSVSFDPDVSFRVVSELHALGARVVVLSPAKDPDLILRAMRAGAREFVVSGDTADLRRAVRAQAMSSEETSGLGSVITVFPCKGGVGATTVAANLAGTLHREGLRVVVVDLDLHLGDVLSFLDLPGTYSITDVIANAKRLDRELLDTSITRHRSGVRVLAQSGKVEEADHVRAADVTALIDLLRQHYDRVVIDGVRGFDEISLAALDLSHHVLLVLTQDVPAVRNAQRCLDLFRRLGYDGAKVHIVLNRYHKGSKITAQVVEETLGAPVAHVIANDFASVIAAINRGQLLFEAAPRSKLTQDIDNLAPMVSGARKEAPRKPGFLRGLISGKNPDGTPRTPNA